MYTLTAERSETGDWIYMGAFTSLEEAALYINEAERDEEWPESYEAMLKDEKTGTVYIYISEWEIYSEDA